MDLKVINHPTLIIGIGVEKEELIGILPNLEALCTVADCDGQ